MSKIANIPNLDLGDYCKGPSADRNQFINHLGSAFRSHGFVIISGHFLDRQTMDALYDQLARVFALPESLKQSYRRPDWSHQRGYTGFMTEHAKDQSSPDLKEFWQIGQAEQVGEASGLANIACLEVPDFLPVALRAFAALERTGVTLLSALGVYLGLGDDYLTEPCLGGQSILRAIHYPPIGDPPPGSVRAAAHEDINLITLLIGASAPGLEIATVEGEWLAVTVQEGQLVCNLGDMLARLTNDNLLSTPHRVVNPQGQAAQHSRYSVPFFMHPRSEMRLDPIPKFVSDTNPARYKPMTAGEYLTERLREIGLE